VITWREVADLEKDLRELEADYWIEAETAEEARERMTEAEAETDRRYCEARERAETR
jgi:hypothetical protein